MNGEVPSVPITTLAGITSLTDLLPELPLPTPLSTAINNKSLLHSAKVSEKSKKLLNNADDGLVEQVSSALQQCSTEHIELKDMLAGDGHDGDLSELYRAILANDPNIFTGGKPGSRSHNGSRSQSSHPSHANSGACPSTNSVQKSPSLPQSVDHFPQPGSSNINGEPNDRRSKRSASATMNSPAQATVAESMMRQSGPHSAKIERLTDPELNDPDEDEENSRSSLSRKTRQRSGDFRKSSEQKTKEDSWAAKMKQIGDIGKPVVMLEMLDPKTAYGDFYPKKEDPWNSKCKPLSVSLEPLDERTLKSIAAGGTVKTDTGRKGSKRHRDHYDDNDKTKRRKTYIDDESEVDSEEERAEQLLRKKKKEKRQRRMNQVDLTIDELLESPTFKKFTSSIEYIFDSAEDVNFGSLDPTDEEVECPPESLISRTVLSELVSETAKLKSMGVLNQVPANTLVRLLTILQWNIRDGTKLLPLLNQDNDEDDEEGQKLWQEISMERIGRSIDSALTAIYIITSPKMPKQVFLEDVIERIVMFGKFQLTNTIYPEYDPVYRISPKTKDHTSLKMKRSRASQVKHKSIISLYNKLSDLVGSLAELVEIQELTDTIILQMSGLGIAPFFVENVSELQLNAMKLVTTVFAHYDKHRQLVLEDIFASIARLPSSKRNLRSYRLNADEHIQMVTALALQLIQCVIQLPQPKDPNNDVEEEPVEETTPKSKSKDKSPKGKRKSVPTDPDVVIVTSYETAIGTGYNFLSVFLKKCTMKGEDDFRPMFENFVQDLLGTVNKPEWPASELLLSILGKILVKQFSNKSTDMSLRTASLEYLGIVAARLRKDAVSSQLNQEVIDEIVNKVNESDEDSEDEENKRSTRGRKTPEPKQATMDITQSLQKAMLDYLAYHGSSEPAYLFARQFYIAQWFRDTQKECEKKKVTDEDSDEEEEKPPPRQGGDAEESTKFLLSQIETSYKPYTSYKPSPSKLNYDSACLVARYLSSKRPFAQSFDIYLSQILKVLAENAVAIRTKAMKCLTSVVESDPGILARPDMERGVHGRFLDPSTSVREAAIELVGKFVLIRPELIPQYYNMLSERILDTGISVRKRVIKIFREIFTVQPNFNKIPDMCVKMIRRVNDEDGIKKLVNEVFQTMWFTPLSSREKDATKLIQRVVNITEVVAASKDTGFEFLEQLLDNLLKKDEHGNHNKFALTSCRQIVDCLVENVLRLEEKSVDGKVSNRLSACLSTLYLFSKSKPDLMVGHATTLQPYLNIKCSNPGDYYVLHYVAKILELVIPLMDHPSENFLMQVEESMIKLILNHGMLVLESCVSCLGAVVNCVSHNYPLVKDCFQTFFSYIKKYYAYHKQHPTAELEVKRKPSLLRSLFTVGLMCKHFNFDSKDLRDSGEESLKETIFDVLVYFTSHPDDDVQLKALMGLGFMAVRHYEYMLGRTLKTIYCDLLNTNQSHLLNLKCQVLKNLYLYLVEEEVRMAKSDAEWRSHAKEEDLKEMGDVQSGMASTIMQVYLKDVLESFFIVKSQVRLEALNVIQLVLRQGLIHPVQCVPYLVSMGTDSEPEIRIKAESQLKEIEKKYPGFIHMKALQGIKMCYRLQELIQKDANNGIIRGLRFHDDTCTSLNAFLYSILRSNRSHRRALLTTLLNHLDDSAKIGLKEQVYITDNLAFFAYQTQDEPLYIIHQIDIIVSVSGSNLLQSFREKLNSREDQRRNMALANPEVTENGMSEDYTPHVFDDDEDVDRESLIKRLPENIAPIKEIILLSQGCILLLYLKQHLKDMYNFTDSKIQNYSPTEAAKVYDKPLQRKAMVRFNPESVLTTLAQELMQDQDEYAVREKLADDYIQFRDLMLSVDPPDGDDSDDNKNTVGQTPVVYAIKQRTEGAGGDAGTTNHVDDPSRVMNTEVNGEGDGVDHNPEVEESPEMEQDRPRIPTLVISTSKLQTPTREKEKKKHIPRSTKALLPGASQFVTTAHTLSSPVHSHTPSRHSSHHSSVSRSHHKTPSSHSKRKQQQKKRKKSRYVSDNSDNSDDSDYDPS